MVQKDRMTLFFASWQLRDFSEAVVDDHLVIDHRPHTVLLVKNHASVYLGLRKPAICFETQWQ